MERLLDKARSMDLLAVQPCEDLLSTCMAMYPSNCWSLEAVPHSSKLDLLLQDLHDLSCWNPVPSGKPSKAALLYFHLFDHVSG